MPTNERARLLTICEVAEITQLSERTIRRRIQAGELAALLFGRHWRIAKPDLEEFLRRHRKGSDAGVL